MTLRPGPLQFDMSLSKRVPFMIRDSIADFVTAICAQVGSTSSTRRGHDLRDPSRRPAILNQIRTRLGIEESPAGV